MGNSTYGGVENIKFVNCKNAPATPNGTGSIFGEGSLTMVVALAALVVAIAAMGMNIASKKKTTSTKAE